jgi:hypothetical protein
MEKKLSMDSKQIALLVTENEETYQRERTRKNGDFFQEPSTVTKEPGVAFVASGVYPREYILDFLKMAKESGATYIMIDMARKDAPMRIGFTSKDKLNEGKETLTYLWLAPRIDNDKEDTLESIQAQITLFSNELAKLKETETKMLEKKAKETEQKPL